MTTVQSAESINIKSTLVNGHREMWEDKSVPEETFFLRTAHRTLHARGVAATLPRGTPATLGTRVDDFFRRKPAGPDLLVGALAFDRDAHDSLVQPATVADTAGGVQIPAAMAAADRDWRVVASPDEAEYRALVTEAVKLIEESDGALSKVVLARRLLVEAAHVVDPRHLVSQLARDASIAAFMVSLPAVNGLPRTLVGGTPELLVSKQGNKVFSNPLAGSARREADPQLDRNAAELLLRSDKDRREHLMVVEAILDNLSPYCSQLSAPQLAQLQTTEFMWHLGTKIEGTLRDPEVSSAELAACLHPTPAVGGYPGDTAQDIIRRLEPFDRGFYAGALGWTDARGDGEWYVTLRCGEVIANRITLYAGAGIVAGSDPQAEAEETSAKFAALLNALGIDEQGRRLKGDVA